MRNATIAVAMLLLCACGKKTPGQEAVAAYEACMDRNKAEKVCEIERKRVGDRAQQVFDALGAKLCPPEVEAAKIAVEDAAFLSGLGKPAEGIRVRREAAAKVVECVLGKEPRLKGSELANDYFRSGQAERDAGLVPK